MHAASVHPEPGSNSRNHGIKTQTCVCGSIAFEFLLLALYFCLSSILILRIVRDPFAHTLYALYFSLVVQFSRISVSAFSRRLVHYTTSAPSCQVFFYFFLKKCSLCGQPRFGVSPIIIPQSAFFVKHFLIFFHFFASLSPCTVSLRHSL